tara:strand:- start:1277 stop:1882 length:606 start_codon:yes stop_codon:yes gene_type:complete
MIIFDNLPSEKPYKEFSNFYNKAKSLGQTQIEAMVISSYNSSKKQVDSRYVNLKYIIGEEWIFFSNYNSKKASDFSSNKFISALFFWQSINLQVRIKGEVFKTSEDFSDKHFSVRELDKNVLAISSRQSQKIESYEMVKENFNKTLDDASSIKSRPSYWGGFSFKPFEFEFWQGNESRLNKRESYSFDRVKESWNYSILEP